VPLFVTLDAEDDYGISALSLYRALNGSRHLPQRLLVPLPAAPKLERTSVLALAEYGLEPGDQITLFGRVEDTDPAGAKGAESAVVRLNIISRALYDELIRAEKTAQDFEKKYDEAARRMEGLRAAAEKLAAQAAAEAAKGEGPSEEMKQKLQDFAQQLAEAAQATRQAADQEPLYALDQDLSENLRQLADAMAAAGKEAQRAAQAGSPQEASEATEMAKALLGKAEGEYSQQVTGPLDRFMKAYALEEMQERFIALADKQRDLAERTSELKGRDNPDDPALKARMRDLTDEQRALEQELNTVLQEIRNRAQELPDDADFARLKQTALQFVDAVEASRAQPAMMEAANALEGFQGTEALARATEAADVLESFIGQCKPGATQQQGQLVFGPSRAPAAATTIQQLLQSAGLPSPAGRGQRGIGSGAGGYSMWAGTLNNVGLYGPLPRGGGRGQEERPQVSGAFSAEPAGGRGVGGITVKPASSGAAEALPLQALPPRLRDGVQAYFRRVAEETSAGTVLEPRASTQNRGQQPEGGTR
jgi:chemotaxis protein histidine kinase CheA